MMAIIEIGNSGSFYCCNIEVINLATVKAAWLHFPSVFISPSTNILVNDKRRNVFVLFFIHQVTIEGVFVFKNIMPDWLDYSSNRLDPRS